MKRKALFSSFLLFGLAAFGAAQSNEFMDSLLDSETVTAGQASYLVLAATDKIGAEAEAAAAFERAQELGWAPKSASADDAIDYAGYSYLVARAFGIKGGIMYSLFPSPRYAYRELLSRRLIQGRSDPRSKLAGPDALRLLNRALDAEGGKE